MKKPKIIVVLGPTASGKSGLAVTLAGKFDGEIVSADSRQVYKGLDIGTGKITKKEMGGIPHHLLDVASPKKIFTVDDYKKKASREIKNILRKNKLPIIVGGTGFYIRALVDNITYPDVPPDHPLRRKLAKKSAIELFSLLKKLDPERAKTVDRKNPRRLIRAIEIARALGKVPEFEAKPAYNPLYIGIKTPDIILKKNIRDRLLARLKKGMVHEAKKLHAGGLSWKRMNELGLEYRQLAVYLQKSISKEEMIRKLDSEIWKYAKRQRTWWKRDDRIVWHPISDPNKIESAVTKFLRN